MVPITHDGKPRPRPKPTRAIEAIATTIKPKPKLHLKKKKTIKPNDQRIKKKSLSKLSELQFKPLSNPLEPSEPSPTNPARQSTLIQTHHQPIPSHHHAQIKPWTQPNSNASLEREREMWDERKRDFAEKKYHHHDLATPRSTTAHREKQGVGDGETKWEWERGLKEERGLKTQKIKREKKTNGIKN